MDRLLSGDALEGLDIREGSVIYNALAPAAVELAKLYVSLDIFFQETFADTASLQYLMRRAEERGLARYTATAAIVQGEFSPAGADVLYKRFACGDLIYGVTERIGLGIYKLECEAKGELGNLSAGDLIPVDHVAGLESAQITALIIPGEDDEDTESLRARFMRSLNPEAYGGNVADYTNKVMSISGVGGVKVYPVWNGGGTVRLAIISSAYGPPSAEQISEVQTAIDPTQNAGEGMGVAPIGHQVTVTGVSVQIVDVSATITYDKSWVWDDLKPYAEAAIDDYFMELAKEWDSADHLVVRISQIESRLLDLEGVLDVGNAAINGAQGNLVLGEDVIPARGDVSG